mmetsp:Transcript_42854/g.89519  ORF Transcript_42854/g.89519 Transcript_42854/m.89519 type:complete len:94 (-) Transcript_42854:144-425(-)
MDRVSCHSCPLEVGGSNQPNWQIRERVSQKYSLLKSSVVEVYIAAALNPALVIPLCLSMPDKVESDISFSKTLELLHAAAPAAVGFGSCSSSS